MRGAVSTTWVLLPLSLGVWLLGLRSWGAEQGTRLWSPLDNSEMWTGFFFF